MQTNNKAKYLMPTEQIISWLLGAISACLVLFLVVYFFMPNIRISPLLSSKHSSRGDFGDCYFMTVSNLSPFRAHHVHVEIFKAKNSSKLSLLGVHFSTHIAGHRPLLFKRNKHSELRIDVTRNLDELIVNGYNSIIVKVSVRHSLSGFAKSRSIEYTDLKHLSDV
jgi:hypothetical protein